MDLENMTEQQLLLLQEKIQFQLTKLEKKREDERKIAEEKFLINLLNKEKDIIQLIMIVKDALEHNKSLPILPIPIFITYEYFQTLYHIQFSKSSSWEKRIYSYLRKEAYLYYDDYCCCPIEPIIEHFYIECFPANTTIITYFKESYYNCITGDYKIKSGEEKYIPVGKERSYIEKNGYVRETFTDSPDNSKYVNINRFLFTGLPKDAIQLQDSYLNTRYNPYEERLYTGVKSEAFYNLFKN